MEAFDGDCSRFRIESSVKVFPDGQQENGAEALTLRTECGLFVQ